MPVYHRTLMANVAANYSVWNGTVITVGPYPDGCTCAAMFWLFLPCWIGLKDNPGITTRTNVQERHQHRIQQLAQQREVLKKALTDVIGDSSIDWDVLKSALRSVGYKKDGRSARNRRRSLHKQLQQEQSQSRRHQFGCYCGIPAKDTFGYDCANTFVRSTSLDRSKIPDRTFAMIKPDTIQHKERIQDLIRQRGFTIVQERVVRLTYEEAGEFYLQNSHKYYYEDLKTYLSSGPVVAMVLAKENAVEQWRLLMGDKIVFDMPNATDTLRPIFGTDRFHNGLHGSDSYLSAECEIRFFFPEGNFNPAIVENDVEVNTMSDEQVLMTCHPLRYPMLLAYD